MSDDAKVRCFDCCHISIPNEKALMGRCWKKGMDVEVWSMRRCNRFSLTPFFNIRHEFHQKNQQAQGVQP